MKSFTIVLIMQYFMLSALVSAHESSTPSDELGEVHFPTSCNAQAQVHFERGIALLHSFWFEAANDSFNQAGKTDTACAMAHWGNAMTQMDNPFGWPPAPQKLEIGRLHAEEAIKIGGKTDREKAYIEAAYVFYKDFESVEHAVRAKAFEKAMEIVYKRYPDDNEAGVLYALALNATAKPNDKTYAQQLKAAEILEIIFAKEPDHPGAAHILIHSYDYPALAERGLEAAHRYAMIAPAAPHALHMPSHIFSRVGEWKKSIESNLDSKAAAQNQFDQLHAMDYLAYAYLQSALDEKAKQIIDDIHAIGKINYQHFVVAYALAAIPARYALDRGQWAEVLDLEIYPAAVDFPWERFPQAEALNVYARALGASRIREAEKSKHELERLGELKEAMYEKNLAYWAEQTEIQIQSVKAWNALGAGKEAEALKLMKVAANLEANTGKHAVMPGPLAPARELLGEMLLQVNRSEEALEAFELSLAVEPQRFRSLYGAAHAAKQIGNKTIASRYYEELLKMAEGNANRAELEEAREFMASQ